jgi:SAM-dependent methyltransferase
MPAFVSCESAENPHEVFSDIYDHGRWGRNSQHEGISGVGSIYKNARPYVKLLQKFINKHHIKTVVDIGCGDWELAKHIRWGSIKYYGYDVVKKVINRDIAKYGSSKKHFFCADGIHSNLPKADLLICKDVLQHLPNEYIRDFISKMDGFKYCLITNDISSPLVNSNQVNGDIRMGSGRFIDLSQPPFNIEGKTILTYSSPGTVKRVFLVCPQKKTKTHSKLRS